MAERTRLSAEDRARLDRIRDELAELACDDRSRYGAAERLLFRRVHGDVEAVLEADDAP